MRFECREVRGVSVVGLAEPVEIDMGNAPLLKTGILDAVGDAASAVFDASHVEFFDSAGMGALLAVQKNLAERGGRLVLTGLNRAVLEIFQMVGFDVVFSIEPDLDTALEAAGAR